MSKPLRVLHFQGRMGKGGAETFMMNTYRNSDRSKIQFDFLIYHDFQDVKPYHKEIHELGGRIFSVPNPKKNIFAYIHAVRKLLKKEKFDIVHNEVFFGGGLNLWLAKKAGVEKRLAHSHATTDGKANPLFKLVRKGFDAMMFRTATDYLACSIDAGKGLFGDDQQFMFVPNGINLELYRNVLKTQVEIRQSLNIPADAFVVGNIGRFEEQKNHRFLIDIFEVIKKKQPNSHLVLIGEGSLEEEIKDKVEEKGMSDFVHFLGIRNDIPQLLKAMNVFLMPSKYEGLPISAVEAQAANRKLVLSTEVSRETKLSENVHFIKLDASVENWADAVLSEPYENNPLPGMEQYDMKHTAELMEKVYLEEKM